MSMRRLFIIRKDLNMKPGKLGAMLAHCAEAYWTNMIRKNVSPWKKDNELGQQFSYVCNLELPIDIVDEYVFGIFTKTICECKNLTDLKKVENVIKEINECLPVDCQLKYGIDYGYINDKCLTDLTPENPDGTTTVGMWFRPLPDQIAHKLSKKYKLYGAFDKTDNIRKTIVYSVRCTRSWCEGEETFVEARYASLEEAKKHLNHLFEKLSKSEEYSDVRWNSFGGFNCQYGLFKYDNTETFEIDEEEIEIKEKFDVEGEG